jgi:hypothetical protein
MLMVSDCPIDNDGAVLLNTNVELLELVETVSVITPHELKLLEQIVIADVPATFDA